MQVGTCQHFGLVAASQKKIRPMAGVLKDSKTHTATDALEYATPGTMGGVVE